MNRDMCIGYVCGLVVGFLLLCLMQGCYLEHEAAPCDAGEDYRDAGNNTAGASAPVRQPAVPQVPTICPGPLVAGECFEDIHDVVSR